MNKLLVITDTDNDFTTLLSSIDGMEIQLISSNELENTTLSETNFSAMVILGSTINLTSGALFTATVRQKLEKLGRNIRVFSEYTRSFGTMYTTGVHSSRHERLALVNVPTDVSLQAGQLLDDYSSTYLPQAFFPAHGELILARCGEPNAHSTITPLNQDSLNREDWALWLENPLHMVCSFPIANFVKARFGPFDVWQQLIAYIVSWITKLQTSQLPTSQRAYKYLPPHPYSAEETRTTIDRAITWFTESGVLTMSPHLTLKEGVSAEIQPTGEQSLMPLFRPDCAGETALALSEYSKLSGNQTYQETANRLIKYCFENMYETTGLSAGMIRWSNEAWAANYSDDSARFLISVLYQMSEASNDNFLPQIKKSLAFLVNTTGPDGLRVPRTDEYEITTPKDIERLHTTPGNFPSAHYNAYYHAAILFYGQTTGDHQYDEVAVTGLHTLMSLYPHTRREHSETQEQCRLVLPLALLYKTSPTPEHRDFLYQVCQDLQLHKLHNAYVEWDSDYSAAFSHTGGTESSLLAENGDPVCDLLYSINWLPLGFTEAYRATHDPWFRTLWEEVSAFLVSCQIHSNDSKIDGGWARGFDVMRREVFAMPNDVGWGPWVIESGWTMGEITAGLALGVRTFTPNIGGDGG